MNSWHAAQQKYGFTRKDVMKWSGIIKAIPNTWKKVVKNEVVDLQVPRQVEMPSACDIKIRGSLTSMCKIVVENVYDLLLEPILKKPASKTLS